MVQRPSQTPLVTLQAERLDRLLLQAVGCLNIAKLVDDQRASNQERSPERGVLGQPRQILSLREPGTGLLLAPELGKHTRLQIEVPTSLGRRIGIGCQRQLAPMEAL